ncbi:hypothetical protein B0H14DRAFT_2581917 [Mycena olivaceomarginata]|nr:hypothetical protein B0H14DRAFT_2581917 [Mycena olivaceomarginata]
MPVAPDFDNDAVMQDDEDGLPPSNQSLLAAVRKLRRIVRAVRSGPQRRAAWKDEVKMSYKDREARKLTGYMLILDVKTRWSSTHQMLCAWRALGFKLAVDNYVAKNKDLCALELSKEDWEAIELVAQWLEAFRAATTQMSATKSP